MRMRFEGIEKTGEGSSFITVDIVARRLHVSRRTIYEWVSQRRIPFYKLGGTLVRFRPEEIEIWTKEKYRPIKEFGAKKLLESEVI